MESAGVVLHAMNRAAKRATLFSSPEDYQAFEEVLLAALERVPLRILAYCVMPNHWHFVAWPREDGELSRFLQWLTMTHAVRWHGSRSTTGTGAVYQGRFKSFPVQSDGHVLRICRYVERNPVRAGLVRSAADWPWGSHARRLAGNPHGVLAEGPVPLPPDWTRWVDLPDARDDLAVVRRSVTRGRPMGTETWTQAIAAEWGLETTLRHRGRPPKAADTRPEGGAF